jgi:hypothetical protein
MNKNNGYYGDLFLKNLFATHLNEFWVSFLLHPKEKYAKENIQIWVYASSY